MKIYHVETQKAYDELMSELEEKGYKWLSGHEPTAFNYWEQNKETSCIKISGKDIAYRDIEHCKKLHPNIPIIEYKAKGENMAQENMTQEEMKRYFLNESRDISIAIENFVVDDSTTENTLSKAKSSAKKLIEKIDEYLESLKPEFKVGDIVASQVFSGGSFSLVRLNEDLTNYLTSVDGFWYTERDCDIIKVSLGVFKKDTRHATPEEIAEYEVALAFHKHGRKPFELKRGDVVYLKGYDKNIFLDSGNIYKKHNFIDGDVVFVKTAEEVNEWL